MQRRAPRRARPEARQPRQQLDQALDFGSGNGGGHYVRDNPGGSGRPPVRPFILSCMTASALRRASACAATSRSSRISFSGRLHQRVVDLDALELALGGELDRDHAAAGRALDLDGSSSACSSCILVCSCAACFIMPMKSTINRPRCRRERPASAPESGIVLRDADDLGAGETLHHRLHQRIVLDVALDIGLPFVGLRAQGGGALFLGHHHDPALAGPAGNLALQIVHQALRRIGLERDLELAVLATHQAHIVLQRQLRLHVALFGGERDQLLERIDGQCRRRLRPSVSGCSAMRGDTAADERGIRAASRSAARSKTLSARHRHSPLPCGRATASLPSPSERTTSSGVGRSAA